ncbi:unnamed protein product [Polarella glacialis]|uniref:Uncharacterized protein n=1 Tax=Polarella glacialis TaxID=89957 RepID=A0A813D7D5_POLGL|nr:unnamed protein product [Polarella glacialis]
MGSVMDSGLCVREGLVRSRLLPGTLGLLLLVAFVLASGDPAFETKLQAEPDVETKFQAEAAVETKLLAEDLRSRLAVIEGVAKKLYEGGELQGPAVAQLEDELVWLERRVEKLQKDDAAGHELYFMVSILRGTIYQMSSGLSDEQVEEKRNAYTFSSDRFWNQYYEKTQASVERFDWYGTWDTEVQTDGSKSVTLGELLRPFSTASFDVVVEKGTLDALQENEPRRTLKPGGYFVSITDLPASVRVVEQLQWYEYWDVCHTHQANVRSSAGEERIAHVHACRRSEDGLWTWLRSHSRPMRSFFFSEL